MLRNKTLKCLALVLTFILISSSLVFADPVHKDIFDQVSGQNIYGHIAVLADKDDARVTGYEGEYAAADYIEGQMKSYGLKVQRQKFPIIRFEDNGAELTMNTPESRTFEVVNFSYTPATGAEGLTREIAYAGLGHVKDFEGLDLTGKIALIRRGDITFYEKTQNAYKAGADGVLIFNHSPGVISGTLGEPTDIPVIALTQDDGDYLKGLLDQEQTVNVTMIADTKIEPGESQNIIGTLSADKNNKNAKTIVIGAHYDSVDTPGANDNASGTATMLEVARVLSDKKLSYNIKFIAFGAEEIGLVGSYEYVDRMSDEEYNKTVAMINMDMVGVGDEIGIMTLYDDSESFVADLAETYVKEFGHSYYRDSSDASDHAPFEEAGIPVVFFDYSPDPNYHTDEDSIDKISETNLYNMGTLVTAMVYDMTKTPMPKSNNGLKAKVSKYKYINPEIPME